MQRPRSIRHGLSAMLSACLVLACVPTRAEETPAAGDGTATAAADAIPTLWIVGEASTVGHGWGRKLDQFFDPAKIHVVNSAERGSPLPGFVTTGQWTKIADALKPGDFVMLHFSYSQPRSATFSRPPRPAPTSPSKSGASRIKQAPNNKKKLQPSSPQSQTNPPDDAQNMKQQAGALRKMIRDARSRQARVILCSPMPRVFQSPGSMNPGFGNSPPRVIQSNSAWLSAVAGSAQSEGAFLLDLAGIGGKHLANLDGEKLNSFATMGSRLTSDESSISYSRLVLTILRGIPGDPLAPYINDTDRETLPLAGHTQQHRFTNSEGKTIDGALVSATGGAAVIQLASSDRKVTVDTATLSDEDQQFIRQWKTENPSFQLTYQATKTSDKPKGASLDDRTYYYHIRITNPSKDATPELELIYHYNCKTRQKGPHPMGDRNPDPVTGSLMVPPIPAGGSVAVNTNAIRLDDQKTSVKERVRMSDGTTQETIISSSRKESMIGIAFDLYLGKKLVSQYRANGFMTDTIIRRN